MSKSAISKASAILVGLSLFAVTASPLLAEDETIGAKVGPVTKLSSSASAATRAQFLDQKIETKTEKLASRAAALRVKLQTFKNKNKAAVAERVNANLNAVNQGQTANMQKYLGVMSTILDKLENRVNQGSPDVKDISGAKSAITSARAVIATSSAAVTAQSLKDYTIKVTSETKIGIDAKLQRDKLHTDLLALRKTIIDAKQSVANTIRIAKSGSEIKEATNSGQQ